MDTKELAVVEYSNERVLTTEQVAEFYECNADNIKVNFNANRERFVDGKHYFKVEGEALSKLRVSETNLQISPMTRSLYLWTKRGCARHAKMLKTDRAWEVFEELEENYFDRKEIREKAVEAVTVHDLVGDVGKTAEMLQQYFGVSKGISLATATAMVEQFRKVDLSPLKEILPPTENDFGVLTPTAIGKQIGKSARTVNVMLDELEFQCKENGAYRLTDEGKKYAEVMPFTRNGHSGYQIRWLPQIVEVLIDA